MKRTAVRRSRRRPVRLAVGAVAGGLLVLVALQTPALVAGSAPDAPAGGASADDQARPPATGPASLRAPTPPPPELPDTSPAAEADTAAGPTEAADAAVPVVTGVAARPTAISIARIGVQSHLIDLDLDEHRRLEVPEDAAVAGWYVRSPRPGDLGPAVIAGHVDSHAGPGVFWRLRDLEAGDEILVERADSTTVRFAVDRVERWPKDDFPTDAVYRHADGAELRLITCGGTFDRAARSYRDNVIVFAKLVG